MVVVLHRQSHLKNTANEQTLQTCGPHAHYNCCSEPTAIRAISLRSTPPKRTRQQQSLCVYVSASPWLLTNISLAPYGRPTGNHTCAQKRETKRNSTQNDNDWKKTEQEHLCSGFECQSGS